MSPTNTFVRYGGVWAPVGPITPLPEPNPEPDPTEQPRPPDGQFIHGEQINKSVIGWGGTLTEWTGGSSFSGTQVIENTRISNRLLTIAKGATITFRNCQIIGSLSANTYTIKAIAGGGQRVTLENCEVISRAGTQSARCLATWDDASIHARRTIFRGGIDNIYCNGPNSPGLIPTGDPVVPMARVLLEECWFGDVERIGTSHTDCIQFDGGGYAVLRRNRIMSYNIERGSDTLTTAADNTSRASGGIIATQLSSNPSKISRLVLRDNWAEGGNYTVDVNPSDGLPVTEVVATGNRFGINHQFGALRLPASLVEPNRDNRWGQTGTTGSGITVTAGQLLPGSSS